MGHNTTVNIRTVALVGHGATGKTTLAKALARSVEALFSRVQFTPDLLPSDITGVSVFNQHTREFEFKPGGIFANIVIADEINRASPKTQSALLEAMAERRVSADGITHPLPRPFVVVATQNPIEMEGTYPLPEAQLDRFLGVAKFVVAAEDEDLGLRPARPHDPAEFQPVHERHLDVGDEDIRQFAFDERKRQFTVGRFATKVQTGARPVDAVANPFPGDNFILDEKDLVHRQPRFPGWLAENSVTIIICSRGFVIGVVLFAFLLLDANAILCGNRWNAEDSS